MLAWLAHYCPMDSLGFPMGCFLIKYHFTICLKFKWSRVDKFVFGSNQKTYLNTVCHPWNWMRRDWSDGILLNIIYSGMPQFQKSSFSQQNQVISWAHLPMTMKVDFWSLPHSWLITGFVTRIIRRVSHVEQELTTFPEHQSSTPVFSGVCVARSFVFGVMLCRSLFLIWSLFFWPLYCQSFFFRGPGGSMS